MSNNQPKLYSRSGFARTVGVTERTLIRWEQEGIVVPVHAEGGRRVWTEENVREAHAYQRKYRNPLSRPTR